MTQFTFTDRETYVAYRANWRAQYKALSQAIRQNKRDQLASKSNAEVSSLQSDLHYLRQDAHQMMLEITEAKKFKNLQMAQAIAEAA